jgi:glyoxylase-like metal-dependent hydrolase (beta-lactamase superfamily II)
LPAEPPRGSMSRMAVEIPFTREMGFAYGEVQPVGPLVRRVVARNPSLFTLYGTNTYLVGRGTVAVVDPGPLLAEHQAALRHALPGETVSHVLVTHRHLDHCEAAVALAQETGAVLAAGRRHPSGEPPAGTGLEETVDREFVPDRVLVAGDQVEGPDWNLEVVPTPGHTSDHLCLSLSAESLLFTGDHVMGWSTSVVIPPDGDMAAYRASLRLLQGRNERTYLPGHGPPIGNPAPYLAALIAHRAEREAEILAALAAGPCSIADIVRVVYAAVDHRLHPAAARSVLAHLRALTAEGRVACDGEPGLEAVYRVGAGLHPA